MRTLLLSAVVPFLGLVACASEQATVEKPTSIGKADEIERLCVALGEPSSCDPCDAGNWYGDGVCDDFCAMPDTADCGAVTSLSSFLAATNQVQSVSEQPAYSYNKYNYRFVATELTQGTADAWAVSGAAMVGSGHALHLVVQTDGKLGSTPVTIALEPTVYASNQCSESYSNSGYVGDLDIVHWQGAKPTRVACTVGGSIRARRIDASQDKIELVFNVQLSDGTAWIDRTLTVDID